jgi:hypothetical protein
MELGEISVCLGQIGKLGLILKGQKRTSSGDRIMSLIGWRLHTCHSWYRDDRYSSWSYTIKMALLYM